jgi:hypothetical protein
LRVKQPDFHDLTAVFAGKPSTIRETELPNSSPSTKTNQTQLRSSIKLAGLLLPLAMVSGCVGGPGSYFESVSSETRQNKIAEASQQSGPAIEPVTAKELAALPAPATASAAAPSTVTASAAPAPEPSSEPLLLTLGLDQNSQGDVLLMPKTQPSQSGFTLPGVPVSTNPSVPTQATGNPIAYADPQNALAPGDQIMANLSPGSGPSLSGDDSGFAIGAPSAPLVDPAEYAAQQRVPLLYAQINHGQCKQGYGPKPKKISATNINPGDPYYIEIRMRKTPLLPVGHTYVAYGRLGADGEILDEKLIMLAPVGGYAGAALASGIPMPGVLTPHRDDCRIRPETGYRVSLNAQRYEKLLMEVRAAKQEKPSYLLFAYNCNHFMTRIAKSVGLKPPRNIYVPALEYIYAMIENNEGRKVSRR